MIEGKVEAAYQTLLHIAKDKNFKGIKMEVTCIWKILETCITPMVMYGAEARTANKKEMEK